MADETPLDLKQRTQLFALRIIHLYVTLPKTTEEQVIGRQVLRSGTSVGAHYREATRARSTAEFVSKIDGALMELEETLYWLELLEAAAIPGIGAVGTLKGECGELTAILLTCAKNAKQNRCR